jgi:hypothetical protein
MKLDSSFIMRCVRLRTSAVALVAILSAAAVPLAQGATIASWNFTGVSGYGASPLAPNNGEDANVSVVGLTRGSGVGTGGTAAGNAWGGNAWDGTTSLNEAVAAGKFATFSVKADSGYKLSLAGFDAYNIRRSGTGPTTGQWQYSLDGANFTSIGGPITWGSNTTSAGNAQSAVDLASIGALQNIDAATTVTFRLANWNASGSGGTWYLNGGGAVKTFTVFGSAEVVPEPATAALAGFGLIGLAISARRRQQI